MSNLAIKVENIGKKYQIGELENYYTFRDMIASIFSKNGSKEYVWALRNINFNVKEGEVLGLIGRNGAGKSTLLKILSRITSPTEGLATIKGRVGSLLEVGTGFHPELTGRENIFLNGSILGMSKKEINEKFDEIVDFAEIERFIDTPVKRYSTGMHVKLAFSVAAHMEPEILLVDEVLAVGDYDFQMKCLGKIDNVSKGGRTVIFVSHNLAMIESLCERCILLENGGLKGDGLTNEITELYLENTQNDLLQDNNDRKQKEFYFVNFSITNVDEDQINWITEGENFSINFDFQLNKKLKFIQIGFQCFPENSREPLFASTISDHSEYANKDFEPGMYSAKFFIQGDRLHPGSYYFTFFSHDPNKEVYDIQNSALRINIKHSSNRNINKFIDDKIGLIKINSDCKVKKLN